MDRRAFLAYAGAVGLALVPSAAQAHHRAGHGRGKPHTVTGWVPSAAWHPSDPWGDH